MYEYDRVIYSCFALFTVGFHRRLFHCWWLWVLQLQRCKTLLVELKQSKKSNVFKDQRLGEKLSGLSQDDKAMQRFALERKVRPPNSAFHVYLLFFTFCNLMMFYNWSECVMTDEYLAPQNIPCAIVLTLGNKVVLYFNYVITNM